MTRPGPLTPDQRHIFTAASETLALLPVPGATTLLWLLGCLAQTRTLTPTQVHEALDLG